MEDNLERLMGKAVIETMKRSHRAREMVRRLAGEEKEAVGISDFPEVDILDTPSELVVLINLPGVHKEDIDLQVTEDSISIEARVKAVPGKVLKSERPTSFKRDVPLPVEIKPEESRARYENGVLKVLVPKLVVVTAQKVKIE